MFRGKYAEAERLFQQALAVLEREPAYQEQAVVTLNNLTFLYSKARRMSEALAYSDRTRALLGTIPNPSPALLVKTLTNAAYLSAYERNTPEAESLFEKAIAISEKDLGPEHPVLGEVLTAYAGFLRQTKQKAKAKQARRRGHPGGAPPRQRPGSHGRSRRTVGHATLERLPASISTVPL